MGDVILKGVRKGFENIDEKELTQMIELYIQVYNRTINGDVLCTGTDLFNSIVCAVSGMVMILCEVYRDKFKDGKLNVEEINRVMNKNLWGV